MSAVLTEVDVYNVTSVCFSSILFGESSHGTGYIDMAGSLTSRYPWKSPKAKSYNRKGSFVKS